MSIVKSYSVGHGDMYCIRHNSDNFTIIDCNLSGENKFDLVRDLIMQSSGKTISRFISTHPDDDHINGLKLLDYIIEISNFYTVKNEATKSNETEDFQMYCELRDSTKAFYLEKGCMRKWMNQEDNVRKTSGITILWPKTDNPFFMTNLYFAKHGLSPNNISPIIKYEVQNGAKIIWMGDLESEFMNQIEDDLELSKVNIVFAPHHGRDSGKIPSTMLEKLDPDIIVIGEAPSDHLHYYPGYNTITQNSAGDITFDCQTNAVHIYSSNENYSVSFLEDRYQWKFSHYIGTLEV